MSFRFWKRIKLAPGVTLNLSKSGGSLSLGPRGAKFTVGPHGKRATVGIPGTGLLYTTTAPSRKTARKRTAPYPTLPKVLPQDRLTLGFFKRLITPDDEEALVDGIRELAFGNEDKAFECLRRAVHLADGAYLAGFLALKKEKFEEAKQYLISAQMNYRKLGTYFSKYGISATMSLPITNEVSAHVGPDLRGVLLGLVEVYQRLKRWNDALTCLEKLQCLDPHDVVIRLSLAELLLNSQPTKKDIYQKVVRLGEAIENDTPIHAALMLYKAKALRHLGLTTAARDTLTAALRRKKGRPEDLLRAIRYERALVYGELGQKSRARAEFEKLYVEAPDFEDVAARLGL